jgi:hypothetical protein
MRRHAASRRRVVERKDRVCRATRLKRADLLKILALKKQRCPGRGIQPRARHHRRAMNVRANSLVCCADPIEIEPHV